MPKPTIEIVPATRGDVSWIAANLNDEDFREIDCQLPQFSSELLTAISLTDPDHSFVAKYNGEPVSAFGAAPYLGSCWNAWMFSTRHVRLVGAAVTRFCINRLSRQIFEKGCLRIEARSDARHDKAHRWLERFGLHPVCNLPSYGTAGEDFILFATTKAEWHVHQNTKCPATCGPACRPERRRAEAA